MEGISNGFDDSSAETINRAKLSFGQEPPEGVKEGPGIEYLCQVLQARTSVSRDGDRGFFVDFVVVESPAGGSPAGFESGYAWFPDKKAQYKAKKEGELKRNIGACYGYDATASTTQVKSAVIAATFVDLGTSDSKINQGVHSTLRGRLVRVLSRPVWSKSSARFVPIYDMKPYLVDGKPVDRPVANAVAAAPAIVTPAPVVAAVTPQPFPPPGYAPHTDPAHAAQGWYYEVATGQPKHERDLRQSA